MKKFMLVATALLMGLSSAIAQSPQELTKKGASYYKKGEYTQAVYWYRKAAEQGDDLAQVLLGYSYKKGEGVTQDYTQAVYWFRKVAEQGNIIAQAFLNREELAE